MKQNTINNLQQQYGLSTQTLQTILKQSKWDETMAINKIITIKRILSKTRMNEKIVLKYIYTTTRKRTSNITNIITINK